MTLTMKMPSYWHPECVKNECTPDWAGFAPVVTFNLRIFSTIGLDEFA